jgi:anti-sigma regulatory factor (Ser/Thr protein kinase)
MWTVHVEPTPPAVSYLRTSARSYLETHGASAILDPVLLLLSELATNAVRHGGEPISVSLVVDDDQVHIEVDDESPDLPRLMPLDPYRVGGNGMRLVDALASSWGVRREAGDGKTVWADVSMA